MSYIAVQLAIYHLVYTSQREAVEY